MSKRTVILRGKSRGAMPGEKVTVDEKTAERLVRDRLADYPPNSKTAEKSGS